MAGGIFTTSSVPAGHGRLNGGLNSTAGPLSLQDNESSDLQNVDFNKFGSVLKRNGYTTLNGSAISGTPDGDGLWWYEYTSGADTLRKAIKVAGDKVFKMDDLDGTWDDISGALTITAGNHCSFVNFLNTVYVTNGADVPFEWNGTGNATASTVPSGLTNAKYIVEYNNYLFMAYVTVSGTTHKSRIYWSNIKDPSTWSSVDFIEVAKDDGQEITGIKVLRDKLIIYKTRSIYSLGFTGDSSIPFVLPGGGKTNSAVGCIAPYSIQELENGHVFLSHDGFYFFDGQNSTKISDKVTNTLNSFNTTRFDQAVSLVQKDKNRYWCAFPSSGQTENDKVVVFDYFNVAWTIYDGLACSAMTTFFVGGDEERPYFSDYGGFTYRADTGENDNPAGVETAIDSYFYTNWKHYDDLIDQKAIPEVTIYYESSNSVLTFAYSYNFETGDQYSQTLSLADSGDTYGTGVYGTAVYGGVGGAVQRRDLTGRGRVVRFKFANSTVDETFQIHGFGSYPHLETDK